MNRFFAALVAATTARLGRRGAAGPKRTQIQGADRTPAPRRYACVEIYAGPHACEAAQRLWSACFLVEEAPKLPLRECTEAHCTCTLIHHPDRRRSRPNGVTVPYSGAERRHATWPAGAR